MPRAQELVDRAITQRGKHYSEAPPGDPTTPDAASFDCSSLDQWACTQIGVAGTLQQYAKCHLDPSMGVDGKVGPATWRLLQQVADGG